eukprot:Blabericola_migrator_1__304@NODE_107_length_14077_cov_92_419629_g95_i0_p6_GENE_NODE_107_length_14077_cov_92_419629_g95_i0NODE_107_length_14077_cov_92_419629_g95_i0_p6_ORF_typecomplete_len341_score56_69TRAUB/PF08164_12/1_1e08CBP_BcsQ/PF06564_12/0_085_NODE_107_length_14077_cov_92_419629_g95_i01112912151
MSLKFEGALSENAKRREEVALSDSDADSLDLLEPAEEVEEETLLAPALLAEVRALETAKAEVEAETDDISKSETELVQAKALIAQEALIKNLLELRIDFQHNVLVPLSNEPTQAPEGIAQKIDQALVVVNELKRKLIGESEKLVFPREYAGFSLKRRAQWEKDSTVPAKQMKLWIDLETRQRAAEATFVYPNIERIRTSVEMLSKGFQAFNQPIDRQVSEFLSSRNFDASIPLLVDTVEQEAETLKRFTDREYFKFLQRKQETAEAAAKQEAAAGRLIFSRRSTKQPRAKADRKAKGRKLDYEPIPELVNFMHRQESTNPTEESYLLTAPELLPCVQYFM